MDKMEIEVSSEAGAGDPKPGEPIYGDGGEGEYLGTIVEVVREISPEDWECEVGIKRHECIVDKDIPDPNADPAEGEEDE